MTEEDGEQAPRHVRNKFTTRARRLGVLHPAMATAWCGAVADNLWFFQDADHVLLYLATGGGPITPCPACLQALRLVIDAEIGAPPEDQSEQLTSTERSGLAEVRRLVASMLDRAEHNGNRGSAAFDGLGEAVAVIDSMLAEAPEAPEAPTCSTCNDTHLMDLRGTKQPCTRCPLPCSTCRARPMGPYCAATPCGCPCHRATGAPA